MPGSSTNKILFIPSWYPNRIEHASGNFIKRLIEADSSYDNVAVLFVLPDPAVQKGYEMQINKEEGIFEVIIYYSKVNSNSLFGYILKAKRRFNAYRRGIGEISNKWGKPQLVHVQQALPAILYARWLKMQMGLRYVITEHSIAQYISRPNSIAERLLFFLQKRAMEGAERIIAVSNYLADAINAKGVKNKYTLIPNAVPLPNTLPDVNPSQVKKRILHISTLAEVKNVKGILRAIKQVSTNRDDFELVIIAEENQQKEIKPYAQSLGLDGVIIVFKDYITDTAALAEFMLSGNFMLMFSHYETFAIVLAESLWVGRPVITSKCGGPQEFINEDFGILVTPGDEKGLEKAIIKMLDTWQLYDSKKMKEFARNNFAPEIIGQKMHSLHKEVIDSTQNR